MNFPNKSEILVLRHLWLQIIPNADFTLGGSRLSLLFQKVHF